MWLIIVVVLVVGALEWNRRRQPYPWIPRAGRTGIQDRDLERVLAELRAAAERDLDTRPGGTGGPRLVDRRHGADRAG